MIAVRQRPSTHVVPRVTSDCDKRSQVDIDLPQSGPRAPGPSEVRLGFTDVDFKLTVESFIAVHIP